MILESQKIVKLFIETHSIYAINISGEVQSEILKKTQEGQISKNLFEEPLQQILSLLKNDSLQRFIHKCKENLQKLNCNL